MKLIFSILFTMAAFCGFSQEIKVIAGDKVEITRPIVKDTIDLVDTYDQDIADIANLNRYIAEMQKNIDEALARKDERLARIAIIEKRAKEIKKKKDTKDPGVNGGGGKKAGGQ